MLLCLRGSGEPPVPGVLLQVDDPGGRPPRAGEECAEEMRTHGGSTPLAERALGLIPSLYGPFANGPYRGAPQALSVSHPEGVVAPIRWTNSSSHVTSGAVANCAVAA